MNKRGSRIAAVFLLLLATCSAYGDSYSVAGFLKRRFHPEIVQERDVEGIESHIIGEKLVLRLDDYIALLLKNSTEIRLTQLDVYNATDAITAAKAPFDPALNLGFNTVRTEQSTFSQTSGAETINSLTQTSQAGYQQVIGSGPTISSSFSAVRTSSNNAFYFFNPNIFDNLSIQITQPLLAGRGNLQLRAPLLIARTQLRIVTAQSKSSIADIVTAASAQYWEAIRARDNIRVQQQSVDLAQKAYEHDKLALELGALSRLDIFQSESQVAQAKLALIQAQYSYREILDILRRAIGADLQPRTRFIEMVLEDDPSVRRPGLVLQPVEEAIAKAMQDRPELEVANRRISIDELNARVSRNSLLPRLDFSLIGGASGLGGNVLPITGGLLGTVPITVPSTGSGDALRQLLTFATPSYGAGLTLGLPIRSSAAKANLADAIVNRTRDQYSVRQLQQQIILEVKNATNELELANQAVNAASSARDLARKNVDAEQQKYELGIITAFELLDAQSRLTASESSLVNAHIGYQRASIAYQRATWTIPYQIDIATPKQP